jgi:hypothetical protein
MAEPKATTLVKTVLEKYGLDADSSCWDCHGTLVIYHKACQIIATIAGIEFAMPQIVHQDVDKGTVIILVEGVMPLPNQGGQRSMWSFGEATPKNNKNSYPYAMAEKRAKDRITLGLAGIHGYVYSEIEAEDFQNSAPKNEPPKEKPAPKEVSIIDWPDELNTALMTAGCENKEQADQVCRWLWSDSNMEVANCRANSDSARDTVYKMDAKIDEGIDRSEFLKESKGYEE